MPYGSFGSAPSVASYPAAAAGMNTGGVGGNVMDSGVVESIYSVYDPFSIQRLAHERHGKRPGFISTMEMLGPDYAKGAKAPTIGHYERNNWVGQMVTVGSIDTAASGAGNDMVIVLGTDNMTNTSAVTTLQSSNIRPKDWILLPSGEIAIVKSKDTSVSPHKVTIAPADSTVNLDDEVTATETYAVVTNSHARASGLPEGLTPKTFKYTNQFAIIKEAARASGSELTNEPFVGINQVGETVFQVATQDAMDRFENARSGMLLWGKENDNVTDANTQLGYTVDLTWTEGFMTFQNGNSYQNTYNPAAFTTDEFQEIAATFEGENIGAQNICSLQGHQYLYILENALETVFDGSLSNAMISASMQAYGLSLDDWQPYMENSSWRAHLGWSGIVRSGFNFHFKRMHEFVRPDGAGASDYDYAYDAIYLPLTYQRDVRTGEHRPAIGYEWKEKDGYSRKVVMGTLNGAGVAGQNGYATIPVDQYDVATAFMISEIAGHWSCPNKIIYHTQA